LTFTFIPSPVFENPANRHCGEPENFWCWSFDDTLRNTGRAGLTVTEWEINLYEDGERVQHNVYGPADFQRFYRGATRVPALGTADGSAVVFFGSSSGGEIELVISGVDAFNRTYRFASNPRLSAQERPGTLRAPGSGSISSAPAPPPRPR
jgi:hypothetical protein